MTFRDYFRSRTADEKVKGSVSEKYGKFSNFPFISIPTMDF